MLCIHYLKLQIYPTLRLNRWAATPQIANH